MNSPDDKNTLARPISAPRPRRAVRAKDFSLPKPYRRQLFTEYPPRLSRMQIAMLVCAAIMGAALVGVVAVMVDENADSPDGKVIVVAASSEIVPSSEVQRASVQAARIEDEAATAAAKARLAAAAAMAVPPPALRPSLAELAPGKSGATAVPPPALLPSLAETAKGKNSMTANTATIAARNLRLLPSVQPGQAAKVKPSKALAESLLQGRGMPRQFPAPPLATDATLDHPAPRPRALLAAMLHDKKQKPVPKRPVVNAPLPPPDPDVVLITAILMLTPPPLPVELAERVPGICTQAMLRDNTCIELQGLRK